MVSVLPFPISATILLVAVGWLLASHWTTRRQRKQWETHREAASAREWRECCDETRALRLRYDPKNEWTATTSLPREYLEELKALHERHESLLLQRFSHLFLDD